MINPSPTCRPPGDNAVLLASTSLFRLCCFWLSVTSCGKHCVLSLHAEGVESPDEGQADRQGWWGNPRLATPWSAGVSNSGSISFCFPPRLGGSQTFHLALVRAELSSIPKQKPSVHWDLQTRNFPSPVIQPLSDFCPESRYLRHLNHGCTIEVFFAALTVCHPVSAVDPHVNSVAQLSVHCPVQGQVIFIYTHLHI